MAFIGWLLIWALTIFFWIIIAQVVLSWLIAFGVVNLKNENAKNAVDLLNKICLLYTSPSPRDRQKSRMPSSA